MQGGVGAGAMEWVTPDVLPPPNTNSGGIFNIEVPHMHRHIHRGREEKYKGCPRRSEGRLEQEWALYVVVEWGCR